MSATAPVANVPRNGAAVLLVDDSQITRTVLQRRLIQLGYDNITQAIDGRQALEYLESRQFDVVLLDIEMPVLDGLGVLARLRTTRRSIPPVIVISGQIGMTEVVRCIEMGAEDYLPKTCELPLLRARLSAVLERKRLRDLAGHRLEQLEVELESARQAQLALVPKDFAAIAGHRVQVHASMVPARQVGGDFYDAMRLNDALMLFAVADVSGKGASAAITMARAFGLIRGSARHLADERGIPDPALILALANDELSRDNPESTFVTAVLGIINLQDGRGKIVNAGHDMPLRFDTRGTVAPLLTTRPQPALGVIEDLPYTSQPFSLVSGEGLLLFSDGVIEAENMAGDFFGKARLNNLLENVAATARHPRVVVERVFSAVTYFAGGAAQADDTTALALTFY